MLLTLAFRHLFVRPLRSLFLLLGFALGVGVMIALLSVGEAMVEQSRDVSLVGGGEITVLPQGIDIEAMRTGGLGGMFFGIDRARFVTRQVLTGPRHEQLVAAVAPAIEGKPLYLAHGGRVVPVRAGGEIPSRATAVGAGVRLLSGAWVDSPADSAYVAPTRQQLYDEIDRFHLPPSRDTAWGEWHYFNVVVAPDEWWYISFLVGGDVLGERWGGQLLVTRRAPDGTYQRYTADVSGAEVTFDTARADLALGESSVIQRDGRYSVRGRARGPAGAVRFDLTVTPASGRYFPPVELSEVEFLSGYVVPALRADASGTLCAASRCASVVGAAAYHDHNWGVWRDVTWEWGTGRGGSVDLLYGGVYGPERLAGGDRSTSPFFLSVVDSFGVVQVMRFDSVAYQGSRRSAGLGTTAPEGFELLATREADSLRLRVRVTDALTTTVGASGFSRVFVQMRGRFNVRGRIGGRALADSGSGFFETYVPAPR